MACCDSIIKCILFIVNFVFVLSGLAILAIGVLAYLNYDDFSKILDSNLASPPIIFMIIGAVIFVVAFLGCCGACCDNTVLLLTYSVLVLLILVAQVAVAIVALANKTDFHQVVSDSLRKEFDASSKDQATRDFLSNLQSSAECCGVNGYSDYAVNPSWWGELSTSCCPQGSRPCLLPQFTTGCASRINVLIDNFSTIIGGVGIGLGVIELLGAISGFALVSFIKRQY